MSAERRVFGKFLALPLMRSTLSLLIVLLATSFSGRAETDEKNGVNGFRAVLLTAEMATDVRLRELHAAGYSAAVLALDQGDKVSVDSDRQAARRISQVGLDLYYWIEVARCPKLADVHPEWMASLQGHAEWRRLHKDLPHPTDDEVVKSYPWIPVFYREAFDAHLTRIKQLLADRPRAIGVFLNDLQGAPSACGCGNPVCRWTAGYGPIHTATPLSDDAPAKFVSSVKRIVPDGTRVIPVWTTECEEHDKDSDSLCAGVDCYKGICWKAYSRQLKPLAEEADLVGALLLYKEFGQDVPFYQQRAGWIGHAMKHGFAERPAMSGIPPIAASRLIAVLQGWQVSEEEIQAQIEQARIAGAAGYIVSLAKIEQSWEPRLMKWK